VSTTGERFRSLKTKATRKAPAGAGKAAAFLDCVVSSIRKKRTAEWNEIESAASIIVKALGSGHKVFYLGEGHMTPLAITFGTAGNPNLFMPIDASDLLAPLPNMRRYDGDVLIVLPQFDTSPSLDQYVFQAKLFGAKVVCIGTPTDRATVPITLPGKSLTEISDAVINTHTPPKDALLSLRAVDAKIGPTSGIMAVAMFYALAVEVAERLVSAAKK